MHPVSQGLGGFGEFEDKTKKKQKHVVDEMPHWLMCACAPSTLCTCIAKLRIADGTCSTSTHIWGAFLAVLWASQIREWGGWWWGLWFLYQSLGCNQLSGNSGWSGGKTMGAQFDAFMQPNHHCPAAPCWQPRQFNWDLQLHYWSGGLGC